MFIGSVLSHEYRPVAGEQHSAPCGHMLDPDTSVHAFTTKEEPQSFDGITRTDPAGCFHIPVFGSAGQGKASDWPAVPALWCSFSRNACRFGWTAVYILMTHISHFWVCSPRVHPVFRRTWYQMESRSTCSLQGIDSVYSGSSDHRLRLVPSPYGF